MQSPDFSKRFLDNHIFLRSRSAQTSGLHVSDKLVQSSGEVVHSDRVFFNDVFVLFVGNCGSDKVVADIHSIERSH